MRTAKRLVSCIVLGLGAVSAAGMAQVVRDGTIGPGASVQPFEQTPGNYAIMQSMGVTASSNLFHSFSEFSISADQSATFFGNASIDNVIASCGLPAHRVLSIVSVLEMRRVIRRVSGNLVARI